MRIGDGPKPPDPPRSRPTKRAAGSPSPEIAGGQLTDATSELNLASDGLSPELQALLQKIQEFPEVRPDVVSKMSRRIKSGKLLTPQAAAEMADAYLREAADSSL